MPVSDVDLIVLATTTPDQTFPGHRHGGPGQARHDGRRRFRCPGRLLRLSVSRWRPRTPCCGRGSSTPRWSSARRPSRASSTGRTGAPVSCSGMAAARPCLQAEEWTGDDLAGVITHHIRTDGTKSDLLYVDGGVSSTGTIGHVRMEGNRVFRHAVTNISSAIQAIYDETGLTGDDIDWFVPHQANKRILDGVAKKMNIAEEKVIVTVQEHANTSAASIPLALNHAVRSGRAKPGDLILSEAMGGGFSWGASLFRL
jgi:3-oxoacyl-[acyl-carrier-protein] synthase-3